MAETEYNRKIDIKKSFTAEWGCVGHCNNCCIVIVNVAGKWFKYKWIPSIWAMWKRSRKITEAEHFNSETEDLSGTV